jgi:hypothetical protein
VNQERKKKKEKKSPDISTNFPKTRSSNLLKFLLSHYFGILFYCAAQSAAALAGKERDLLSTPPIPIITCVISYHHLLRFVHPKNNKTNHDWDWPEDTTARCRSTVRVIPQLMVIIPLHS